ncbi:MAG: hypothetical protein R2838_06700 [Caldilineaceae bacterium]
MTVGGWAGYARYLPLGGRVGRPVRQHAGRVAGRPPGLGVCPLQCLHARRA